MIRINLLKPGKKEITEAPSAIAPEIRERKKGPAYGLVYLVFIAVIAALFLYQKNTLSKEQSLLQAAQIEKKSLQDVEVKLEQLEQQKSLLERKINLINQLKSRQEVAIRIMDELSKNIPDWVWLTETSFKNEMIQIKGRALSNNLIADYIYNLDQSPYFNNVNLISSTQKKSRTDQYLEFLLTLNYISPTVSSATNDEVQKRGGE